MKMRIEALAAVALAAALCSPAQAQQRGTPEVRAVAPMVTRPPVDTRPLIAPQRPMRTDPALRGPIVDPLDPRGSDGHLRRRIYNACHGDSPPDFCVRIFGDDNQGNLRRRIRNACFNSDSPPVSLCRRVYGDRFRVRRDRPVAGADGVAARSERRG